MTDTAVARSIYLAHNESRQPSLATPTFVTANTHARQQMFNSAELLTQFI